MNRMCGRGVARALVVLTWAALVFAGFLALVRHAAAPGDPGTPPHQLPGEVRADTEAGGPMLYFFAHPRCPCTGASLEELARLMARCEGRMTVVAYFYRPGAEPFTWSRTAAWSAAAEIPGVRVVDDRDGEAAERFGVMTSGHALLFDAAGVSRFSGGLTAARGHAGDSEGADAVARVILRGEAGPFLAPVFGCPIRRREGLPDA